MAGQPFECRRGKLMALSTEHHVLLQAIMALGPLSEDATKKLHSELTDRDSDLHFHAYLSDINKRLQEVQMELRGSMDQGTGTIFYGVVNQLGDDQSKLGTTFTPAENTFFKTILEKIVVGSDGAGYIAVDDALLLRAEPTQKSTPEVDEFGDSQQNGTQEVGAKQLTRGEKEKAVKQLVAEQWLWRRSEDTLALGVRTFLELKSFLKSLDGVTSCVVCNEAAIMAETCRSGCGTRIHASCVKRRCRNNVGFVCPNANCQAEWHDASAAKRVTSQARTRRKVTPRARK